MKEIFIRLLASIPCLSVGIAAICAFAMAFEDCIFGLLFIGLGVAFVVLFIYFDDLVEDVYDIIDILTN